MDVLKRCSRCLTPKPLDHFPRDSRTADQRHSWCRPCMNDYRREWLARNPHQQQRRRDGARRRYHAHREDRVIAARINRRDKKPTRLQTKHTVEPYRPPSCVEVVDAEPFRDFLAVMYPGMNAGEIATLIAFAVSDRRLREIFRGAATVELDTVDRFFTRGLGRPDLLNAVYPWESA
jgi:hypothetical protein